MSELLATTDLHLVVTSRAALRLSGEYEWPVPPAVARRRRGALRRARAVRHRVRGRERAPVGEICRRLDGLPLAIELAAARSRTLSPPRSSSGSTSGSCCPPAAARELPSRQQTLRGAIDWSYDLLAPDERVLFARLAVFAGGCSLEAAEEVCDAGLDALESLLENNLLRREERPYGDLRFRMLETIREYAGERLEELGERAALRQRHAEWFVEWSSERRRLRREAVILGEWERESDEYENLRSALAWLRSSGEIELELQLATALGGYWGISGYLSEGRAWLEDALTRADDVPPLCARRRCTSAPACRGDRTTPRPATAGPGPRTRSSSPRARSAAPPKR